MWKIPPESGQHCCTWLAWPWDVRIWSNIPGTSLEAAQKTIERLIRIILKYENVRLLAPSDKKWEIEQLFRRSDDQRFSIEVIAADYNDIWVRDTLPTFATTNCGSLIAIDWAFNGWGRRIKPYAQYGKDTLLSRKIAALSGATMVRSGVTAEGGAFAFDGGGLMVVTRSVMFDRNRNQELDRGALESALLKATCCSNICWLPGDRHERITCGHADGILSFGTNNVVFFHWIDDETSSGYDVCDYNLRVFREWADRQGRCYEIVRLAVPNHPYGESCCASFVNFAYVNGAVIVPKFGEAFGEGDNWARDKIAAAFNGNRKVEMLDVHSIAVAGGGIHCATCHEPVRELIHGIITSR